MPKFIKLTKISNERAVAVNIDHVVSYQTRETLRAPEQKGCLVMLINDRIEVAESFEQLEQLIQ